MRLKKIKLSGFKSFVDMAIVPVDNNLVGIVGPNGCGKSNVIDAVRWVMGESSAKQLRGDSMTDVIFNGASGRKPVGQASIELVFDNTVNPLVGQYAQYSELAIKRVINREAQSTYYLNNTRCRRKDLADVFLGTGLGPRSYSIIEQGMISRIIEAKPEDLRLYLEEAAGISKYKERRRETETRIKHTRENLDRVNDIILELAKQLEKLANQAKVAELYTSLKQEFIIQEKYDLGLQYQQYENNYNQITEEVTKQSVELEQLNSQIESCNTELEHKKIAVSKLQHQQQEEQAKFYKIEQTISNTEQEIKHQESEKNHVQQNLISTDKQFGFCQNNIQKQAADLVLVNNELEKIEPEYETLNAEKKEKEINIKNIEQEYNAWEEQWKHHQELEYNNSKTINQSQAIIEKHDTLLVRTQKRIELAKQEQQQLKLESRNQNVDDVKKKQLELQNLQEQKQQELEQVITKYKDLEETLDELQDELNNYNKILQTQKGKLTSLETLQEHALGKNQDKLNKWLQNNGLDNTSRLGEIINIEPGWEAALETILKDYIKAIVLPESKNFDDYKLLEQDLAKVNTAFLSQSLNQNTNLENINNKNNLLINKISAPKSIYFLLNNIYCAEDITEAKNLLGSLDGYASVVTKDGMWLNNNWLTANNFNSQDNKDSKDSVLARKTIIKELKNNITELEKTIEKARCNLNNNKTQIHNFEETRDDLQRELRELLNQISDTKSIISRNESKVEQQRNRLLQIDQDLMEAIKHVDIDSQAVKQERSKLEKAMESMGTFSSMKSNLQHTGNELKLKLRDARNEIDRFKENLHKLDLRIQKLRQDKKHFDDELIRLEKQKIRLIAEQTSLQEKLRQYDEPIAALKIELDRVLGSKQEQMELLALKNQDYEVVNQEAKIIEKKIFEIRKEYQLLRDKIEAAKIKQHEVSTRLATIVEVLQEKDLKPLDLLATLPQGLVLSAVKNKIKELKNKIDDLGPVNLTAIEEYKVESERKTYLNTQEADLQEALTALEDAIRQIDDETKTRFKETFDFVNEQFQTIFPKVFGGGRAMLTLSGEDLLDTGVTVMAQPPGKRNTSINLLSGGEKTLSAIALVFSIFRLNPAPFCMLDEVDAPLDDANVHRYCNLVKEMSKDIQFIFITHNKVTMTMAEHLIGVTMQEPGVSRLVAVNVEQAVELAEID